MKKIGLLILALPILLSSSANTTLYQESTDTDEGFIAYEENENTTSKINVKNQIIGDSTFALSETYVQYGKKSNGNDVLRFSTAVRGNLHSLTYYYTYNGATKSVEISTLYRGLNVNDEIVYYTGSTTSTSTSYMGQYYWACFALEFYSEKQVNTQFTAYLKATTVDSQERNTANKTTTVGNLKHKGYSITNQVDNNTQFNIGSNSVTITNTGHWDVSPKSRNSVLINDLTYQGNYSISTDISLPNVTFPITQTYNQGLVFYYVDDNNYLIAYTNYTNEENTKNRMREIQITGVINGKDLGWADFWTDNTSYHNAPNATNTLTIKKEGAKFYPYLNGQAVGYWYAEGDYRYCLDLSAYGTFNSQSKVGYHIDTDQGKTNTVTFSNTTVTKIQENLYSSTKWSVKKGTESNWTVDETNKTITSTNGAWMSNFFICDSLDSINETSDDSTISVKIKGTKTFPITEEARVGIVPWYYDENNYVIVYLDWDASTEHKNKLRCIQMTGKINNENLTVWNDGWKKSEWNDMWAPNTAAIQPSDNITLSITKKVTNTDSIRFNITVSNDAGTSVSAENGYAILPAQTGLSTILPNGKIGLIAQLDIFTFSEITKTYTN